MPAVGLRLLSFGYFPCRQVPVLRLFRFGPRNSIHFGFLFNFHFDHPLNSDCVSVVCSSVYCLSNDFSVSLSFIFSLSPPGDRSCPHLEDIVPLDLYAEFLQERTSSDSSPAFLWLASCGVIMKTFGLLTFLFYCKFPGDISKNSKPFFFSNVIFSISSKLIAQWDPFLSPQLFFKSIPTLPLIPVLPYDVLLLT